MSGVHPWVEAGKSSESLIFVSDYLRACISSDLPILDAGCGSGALLAALWQRGFSSLYGCDIEPSHIEQEICIALTGCSVSVADFTLGNPFPEVSYAAIVALNWLHNDWRHKHATGIPRAEKPDPDLLQKVFGVVKSCLLPDGVFIADHGWEPQPLLDAASANGFAVLCQLPTKKPTFVFHRES